MIPNLLGSPLDQGLPLVHDHDAPGDGEDDVHVMLAEENGQPPGAGQALDELDVGEGLFRGHAGRRLVQDEQLRFIPQGNGDLQDLLVSMGKGAHDISLLVGQADALQKASGFHHGQVSGGAEEDVTFLLMGQDRHLDVLKDR